MTKTARHWKESRRPRFTVFGLASPPAACGTALAGRRSWVWLARLMGELHEQSVGTLQGFFRHRLLGPILGQAAPPALPGHDVVPRMGPSGPALCATRESPSPLWAARLSNALQETLSVGGLFHSTC